MSRKNSIGLRQKCRRRQDFFRRASKLSNNPQPPSPREGDREAVVGVAKVGQDKFAGL